MYFASLSARLLFMTSAVGIFVGLTIFIVNIAGKDEEYENFLPWSARLIIYGLAYALFPPAGIVSGLYFAASPSPIRKRFGVGSLYISAVYVLAVLSELAGARLT